MQAHVVSKVQYFALLFSVNAKGICKMRAAREAHVRKIFIVMQRVQQIHARAVLLVFFI